MINAAERMVMRNEEACAFIITGSEKVETGYGNGDCLLLDFSRGLFALSDSAERYPAASRDLLVRFMKRLESGGAPLTEDGWREAVNSAYSGQAYHHKTTFCCAAMDRTGPKASLVVLHGGDSLVYVADSNTGDVLFRTAPNMNFAGRSPEIHHAERIALGRGTERVLLCSDGLADMAKTSGVTEGEFLKLIFTARIEDIPGRIRPLAHAWKGGGRAGHYDDVGVIVFDAARLTVSEGLQMLMGGTSPYQEREFQTLHSARTECDRWVRGEELAAHDSIMEACGIMRL